MLWNKKNKGDSGLPDLPPAPVSAPSMKDYPYLKSDYNPEEIHSLPSFPDSPMNKGFSQSAIKEAVETGDEEDLPEIPGVEKNQMPSYLPSRPAISETTEWPSNSVKRQNKPIFIRLDKFQNARDSIEIVKDKLKELDELFRVIKEVKAKENQEIYSCEKEIESIKLRLNSITSEIFDSAY